MPGDVDASTGWAQKLGTEFFSTWRRTQKSEKSPNRGANDDIIYLGSLPPIVEHCNSWLTKLPKP